VLAIFGGETQSMATELISNQNVLVAASDCHNFQGRVFDMIWSYERPASVTKQKNVNTLMDKMPSDIIQNNLFQ
jgi:tyrosine-protein phosphatase YwqE